jgi:hypothetical protein
MSTDTPGFTAEASLHRVNTHYRATTEANSRRGVIHPTFSDVFRPDWPVLVHYSSLFDPWAPVFCITHTFSISPTGEVTPHLGIGVWDPISNRCK